MAMRKELPPGWELPPATTPEQAFQNALTVEQRGLEVVAAMVRVVFHVLGDKSMPLQLICLYFTRDRMPPKWAREELIKAYKSGPKSWDDVFGKPRIDGKRSRKEERAYREGQRLRKQGYKVSDDSLFPALGAVLGVPSGTAKDYYYGKAKRAADELLATAMKLGMPEDLLDMTMTPGALEVRAELDTLGSKLLQNADLIREIYAHGTRLKDQLPPDTFPNKEGTSEKRPPEIRKNKYPRVSARKQRTSEK